MKAAPRRGEGFALKDFALRNAAWAVSDMVSERAGGEGRREGFQAPIEISTPVAGERLDIADPAEFTRELKQIAKLFGADLVGICEHDERWLYSARVDTRDFSESTNELPDGIGHVIVLGHAMDRKLVDTYPSALAGVSTGLEYSHEASIVIQLASYIRNLGYEAVPSMNDTGLVIPLAVKAGLGEYGRNQMVITPEFGPRLRFSKIFTSLPLVPDEPRRNGVKEYCDICTKCAEQCPPKALPFGPPSDEQPNRSTIRGVKKWSADCEKCFFLLGQAKIRLRDLHAGLPVQPQLFCLAVAAVACVGHLAVEGFGEILGGSFSERRQDEARSLVGRHGRSAGALIWVTPSCRHKSAYSLFERKFHARSL